MARITQGVAAKACRVSFVVAGIATGLACGSTALPDERDDRGDGGDAQALEVLDGDGGDAAATCRLPGTFGWELCQECVGARCCAQVTACEQNAGCAMLRKCALECLTTEDGGACYQTCLQAHAEATAQWQTVHDCWFGRPPSGCLHQCANP